MDDYTKAKQRVDDLERRMSECRRRIRHALKKLNHEEFENARFDADIVAQDLAKARFRLERLEMGIKKGFRDSRPSLPESHPIDID